MQVILILLAELHTLLAIRESLIIGIALYLIATKVATGQAIAARGRQRGTSSSRHSSGLGSWSAQGVVTKDMQRNKLGSSKQDKRQ